MIGELIRSETIPFFPWFLVPKKVIWKKSLLGSDDNWLFWTRFQRFSGSTVSTYFPQDTNYRMSQIYSNADIWIGLC